MQVQLILSIACVLVCCASSASATVKRKYEEGGNAINGMSEQPERFVPGSAIWPSLPETVEYAVWRISTDERMDEKDKVACFDRYSVYLHVHKHYDALACLLSNIPLEYSKEMLWSVLRVHSTLHELAKLDPRCLLRIWSDMKCRNSVELWNKLVVLSEVVSVCRDISLFVSSFSYETLRDAEFLKMVFLAIGRSCASTFEGALGNSGTFQKNEMLISWFATFVPSDKQAILHAKEYAILYAKEYAILLNNIRFGSANIKVEAYRAVQICYNCQLPIPGGGWGCVGFCNEVSTAMIAAMYSQRKELVKQLLMNYNYVDYHSEVTAAFCKFEEFIEFIPVGRYSEVLGPYSMPPIFQDRLHIARKVRCKLPKITFPNSNRLSAEACLVLATEMYTEDDFMKVLKAASTDFSGFRNYVRYFAEVFNSIEPNYQARFISVFKLQIGNFSARDTFPMEESVLRALLNSNALADKAITDKLSSFTIEPSLQLIHALLNDDVLAASIGTDEAEAKVSVIRERLSARILTKSVKYNLHVDQILRLLTILKVQIHELSFTLGDGMLNEPADQWLEANCTTFGDMAKNAIHPGFLARLAYSVFMRRESELRNGFADLPSDRFYWEEKLDINGWPENIYEWRPSSTHPPLKLLSFYASMSGSPNPFVTEGFELLYLWYLHDYNNFMRFAPPLVQTAFASIPRDYDLARS